MYSLKQIKFIIVISVIIIIIGWFVFNILKNDIQPQLKLQKPAQTEQTDTQAQKTPIPITAYTNIFDSNKAAYFSLPGWKDQINAEVIDNAKGFTIKNDDPQSFMHTVSNPDQSSNLLIKDNAEISMRFRLSNIEVREGSQSNQVISLELYSSSTNIDGQIPDVFSELDFVDSYEFKGRYLKYRMMMKNELIREDVISIYAPYLELEDFEVKATVLDNSSSTKITITNPNTGEVIGESTVDYIVFPVGHFLNFRTDIGNQFSKINISNFSINCTRCLSSF